MLIPHAAGAGLIGRPAVINGRYNKKSGSNLGDLHSSQSRHCTVDTNRHSSSFKFSVGLPSSINSGF